MQFAHLGIRVINYKDNVFGCVFRSYDTELYFGRLPVDLNGMAVAERMVFLCSKVCN